jgi:ribosome biogenesis protein Nip4
LNSIYTESLKAATSAVFKAKIKEGGKDIIIKFTRDYGESVHRHLEGMDMAPKLLSIVQEHTFKMIVMVEQDFLPLEWKVMER